MHVINMSAGAFFGSIAHTSPVLACRTRVEKRQERFIFPACLRRARVLALVHHSNLFTISFEHLQCMLTNLPTTVSFAFSHN